MCLDIHVRVHAPPDATRRSSFALLLGTVHLALCCIWSVSSTRSDSAVAAVTVGHKTSCSAEVGAGYSLAHAAVASLLAVVTVLTILETEGQPLAACTHCCNSLQEG